MKILNYALNLIYPQKCGICHKIGESLCKKCEIELIKPKEAKIKKYIRSTIFFDEQLYFFNYHGRIRRKIIQYKFSEKSFLYKMFLKIILKNKKTYRFSKKYDIIISVPISKKRLGKRGYNQSELIARELAKNLNIKYEKNVLIKLKDNKTQSTLGKKQRQENVKNVYEVKNEGIIKNKNIIIFDDIFTTGSTVNECSKILKQNGAKYIGIITIAKD